MSATIVVDDERKLCPICLEKEWEVIGPCRHPLCRRCMEQILLSTNSNHDFNDNGENLAVWAPTIGRCPMCRTGLTLFELTTANNCGQAAYEKQLDWSAALKGCVFVSEGEVGLESFHFPSDEDGVPPYVSYSSDRVSEMGWVLDDGSPPPERKRFEEGCHFHQRSRSFHGTLQWSPKSWYGAETWEVILQVSADLRYVCGGAITMHRNKTSPLDGRYQVTWFHENEGGTLQPSEMRETIDVVAGRFSLYQIDYRLCLDDPRAPYFEWPSITLPPGQASVRQTVQSGVDLIARPEGPPVDGLVEWTTNDSNHPLIQWKRLTLTNPNPPPKLIRIGPRGRSYLRHNPPPAEHNPPTYSPGSICGNTFIQGLKIGLASYHFLPDNNNNNDNSQTNTTITAYISYEHPHCAMWPPLDDGSPVPSRVYFVDTHFDPNRRMFKGTIPWLEVYGTTWQGCASWKYEMIFDSEYICILSGKVLSTRRGGGEEREMSTFGEDLVYVNAAAARYFVHLLEMSRQEEEERNEVEVEEEEEEDNRPDDNTTSHDPDSMNEDTTRTTQHETQETTTAITTEEQTQNNNNPPPSQPDNHEPFFSAGQIIRLLSIAPDLPQNDDDNHDSTRRERLSRVSNQLSTRLQNENVSIRTMTVLQALLASVQQHPESRNVDADLLQAMSQYARRNFGST